MQGDVPVEQEVASWLTEAPIPMNAEDAAARLEALLKDWLKRAPAVLEDHFGIHAPNPPRLDGDLRRRTDLLRHWVAGMSRERGWDPASNLPTHNLLYALELLASISNHVKSGYYSGRTTAGSWRGYQDAMRKAEATITESKESPHLGILARIRVAPALDGYTYQELPDGEEHSVADLPGLKTEFPDETISQLARSEWVTVETALRAGRAVELVLTAAGWSIKDPVRGADEVADLIGEVSGGTPVAEAFRRALEASDDRVRHDQGGGSKVPKLKQAQQVRVNKTPEEQPDVREPVPNKPIPRRRVVS